VLLELANSTFRYPHDGGDLGQRPVLEQPQFHGGALTLRQARDGAVEQPQLCAADGFVFRRCTWRRDVKGACVGVQGTEVARSGQGCLQGGRGRVAEGFDFVSGAVVEASNQIQYAMPYARAYPRVLCDRRMGVAGQGVEHREPGF